MSTRVRGDQNSLFREESLSKKGELIHVQYPKSRIEFLHLSLMYLCYLCCFVALLEPASRRWEIVRERQSGSNGNSLFSFDCAGYPLTDAHK